MTLESIGQKLKSAREAQGLSLRQIYERTKIPINHLQAIDGGQPDDLPEPVYVAGFIKRYAECIGLDGQVLSDEYRREEMGVNGKSTRTHAAAPVYVTSEYLKHTRIDSSAPSWKMVPFYVIGALLVLALFSWFSSHSNTAQQDPNVMSLKDSIPQSQNGITAPTPGGAVSTAPATPQTTAAADANASNKVTLSAKHHVWVEVKRLSNGESLYNGAMELGDKKDFQDSQGLRVIAGKGKSLSVEFKGKIEDFGPVDDRLERTFLTPTATAAAPTATPGSTTSATTGDATSASASAAAAAKASAKKTAKTKDASAVTKVATKRHSDDGTRSIPSMGGDGYRSIDVPYRYSEGRLDAN